MASKHPWLSGPTELVHHALMHLAEATESHGRVAFLLLDDAVEMILRTYLQHGQDGASPCADKRDKPWEANFPALMDSVRQANPETVKDIDVHHIGWYHNKRNKLYHDGNGITIPLEKVEAYACMAVELLRVLLGVDLAAELAKCQQALIGRPDDPFLAAVQAIENEIRPQVLSEMKGLERDLRLAVERIEPAFLLPSFEQWLEDLGDLVQLGADYQMSRWCFHRHITWRHEAQAAIGEYQEFKDLISLSELLLKERPDAIEPLPEALRLFAKRQQLTDGDLYDLAFHVSPFSFHLEVVGIVLDWFTLDVRGALETATDVIYGVSWPAPVRYDSPEAQQWELANIRKEGERAIAILEVIREAVQTETKPIWRKGGPEEFVW